MAQSIGITPGAISMYATGERELPKSIAFLIEKTYGISSEWLLHGSGEMKVSRNQLEQKLEEENALLRKLDKNPKLKEIMNHLVDLDKSSLVQILAITKTFSKK